MKRQTLRTVLTLIMTIIPLLLAMPASAAQSDWVVDAHEAKKLIEAGKATVLDTRGKWSWLKGHAPNAQPVKWQKFSRSDAPHKGELLADDQALTEKLQKLGVSKSRPVIVVGKPPKNWGEDGRIVWMLRELGHPRAALVSGGNRALKRAGLKMTRKRPDVDKGDFVAKHTGKYLIERDALKAKLGSKDVVIVDTREEREYDGKTPYGESRGGHVPGAKHLYYKDLMRSDGQLRPADELKKTLAKKGITPDKTVVSYCTGGVRSGWLTVVLRQLGYGKAVNYAGSMWEWSAGPATMYPLEK